ncbi:MAG: GNAT family N-acetyltransferase [Streptosporangiales bacterium]|nr:GNAT family N-acetyltransferase [Streptosporangiales bacterium]
MPREFTIEMLPSSAAADRAAMSALAGLVNDVYAAAEKGLWADGATRISPEALSGLAGAAEIAVATRKDAPIGCVRVRRLEDDVSEFGLLAAARSHQGTGVGRELVRFAEDRGRDLGCGAMQLELLVPREWTHPSKEFLHEWYLRLGYTVTDSAPVEELEPGLAPLLATPCEFAIYRKDLV